jgi:hypothetical protein
MTLKLYIEPYGENGWTQTVTNVIPHTLVSIDECDYIVSSKIPWGCINNTLIQEVLNSYQNCNKKVLVFLLSDYNEPFDIPKNVLFFRTGFYKSQKRPNQYLLPFIFAEVELQGAQPLEPLAKVGAQPSVGFCGSITSHPSRLSFINKLKMATTIKKKLILKTEYWGGNPHNNGVVNEFVTNIKDTHFTLSTRGTGNWSARFYQVLYLGRIPIYVNTDMELPFEDRINWRDTIVYCDSENDIATNVKFFWSTKDIVQAQLRCKEIYNTYLAPHRWGKIITEEILIPNK